MYKMIFFIAIGTIYFSFGCKDSMPSKSEISILDSKLLDSIYLICQDIKQKPFTVYCMDGDCASCIAKAKDLEMHQEKQTIDGKIFLLATTRNSNMLMYNFKQAKINSCLWVVEPEKIEGFIFPLHSITKVDSRGAIKKQILHY